MDGHRPPNELVVAPDDSPELWTDRSAEGVQYLVEAGELNPDIAALVEAERFQTRIDVTEPSEQRLLPHTSIISTLD